MKKNSNHQIIGTLILLLVILLTTQNDGLAQGCVQCRMAPQSNLDGGGQTAGTINSAILYLMAIPYFLLLSLAVYIFRKPIRQKIQEWKLRKLA